MATLLMNLRHVPDDEADEVRDLLAAHGVGYYETPPHRWGVSMGGIWLRDDDRLEEVRTLLADYQTERSRAAREARERARAAGELETTWGRISREPIAATVRVFLAAGLVYLMVAPFYGLL